MQQVLYESKAVLEPFNRKQAVYCEINTHTMLDVQLTQRDRDFIFVLHHTCL